MQMNTNIGHTTLTVFEYIPQYREDTSHLANGTDLVSNYFLPQIGGCTCKWPCDIKCCCSLHRFKCDWNTELLCISCKYVMLTQCISNINEWPVKPIKLFQFFKIQWLLHEPSNLSFKISAVYPHSAFVGSLLFSE
jgi:hypothetical protein